MSIRRSEAKPVARVSAPNENAILVFIATWFLLLHLIAVATLLPASTREPITRSLESLALYD